MDFGSSRLYEIELWSAGGTRLADISALATNRSWNATRNDVEELTFTLDLFAFENYCATNLGGADPKVLIQPYVTDVKLKRAGTYLYGFQVVDVSFDLAVDSSSASDGSSGALTGSSDFAVTVTCTGYLNLLKDRYITKSYAATERTAIAADIIATTQATTNGSVGVTIAGSLYATGQLSDRTYSLDNVKTKLQELAALTDAPYDFYFDPFKVFHTVAKLGARRTDVALIYGGPLSNVAGFSLDRSAANVFNYIWGVGSGSGDVGLTSNQGDVVSQLNYYRREKIDQFSTVIEQTTLDQDVAADVFLYKDILELPTVTITSKQVPSNFLSVGDRIPLQVLSHPWLSNINGLYRIEKLDVSIDENDFETITLTFDSWGVNQSE